MKLSDLREVQNRERSTDSLQELPDSFYEDVAEYIQELKTERERRAERADNPFDVPDIDRLTDEIKTAEQVAEAVYERRVGKIVRQASFAAADMSGDVDGLTVEERRLYEDITDRIGENKAHVLDVLGRDADPEPGDGGDGDTDAGADPNADGTGPVTDTDRPAVETAEATAEAEPPPRESSDGGSEPPDLESEPAADGGSVSRSTVRVTRGVGEVFGVDERVYQLESEDVVSLPEENADALVAKGAAERL